MAWQRYPKPRQVSVLLHPLVVGSEPLLWRDWGRRFHRRACIQLVRHQWIKVEVEPPTSANLTAVTPAPLSRAQRAHYRLSWAERLARNARPPTAGRVTITLFGVPQVFATWLGLTAGERAHDEATVRSEEELAASLARSRMTW